MQDSQAAANLSTNLRLAASYYPSVTQMCRKLGINRQQFVKYLAGTTFPTPGTMRRICDFIGVDEFEVLMPPDQFRNIIALRVPLFLHAARAAAAFVHPYLWLARIYVLSAYRAPERSGQRIGTTGGVQI
jgi:transcriptional regulator with XRE-family HTH domain